jgi:hypothetical protein
MNAYFFLTVKGFAQNYKKYYQYQFQIDGKLKKCYIPRFITLFAYIFVAYLKVKYKKILK